MLGAVHQNPVAVPDDRHSGAAPLRFGYRGTTSEDDDTSHRHSLVDPSPSAGYGTLTWWTALAAVALPSDALVGGTLRSSNGTCVVEDEDVAWAQRPLGIDEQGREVVSWIAGVTAASGEEIDVLPLVEMDRSLRAAVLPIVGSDP